MKNFISLMLASLLIVGLTACTSATPAADPKSEEGASTAAPEKTEAPPATDGLIVGYACKDVNDTFQTYLIEAAQEYATENNITLNVVDAQNDVVKQQDQVNNFITQGVDALVVPIIDTSTASPMTAAAQAANIPLVYVNTNPYPDGDYPEGVYYVGSIEREAGYMQAEYIGGLLGGKGNVTIIQGLLGHEGALQRSEGVVEKLAELYPDIKVLAQLPADWQKDKAMGITENWLTAYNNDIQAVFANNDEMAMGAANALLAVGLTDTLVVGIDGTTAALDAIKAGTLAGSVFQDANGQAKGAMAIAASAAKGETIAEQVQWVPFVLITPENVDEFIK